MHDWQVEMRRQSPLLAIRGLQIETTMKYHHTPIRTTKLKKMTIPNACKNAKKLDLSELRMDMESGTATSEKSLAIKKTKHTFTMQSRNPTPAHRCQRNKNLCPHKNPCMNTHNSFIHKNQKLEAP